MENRYSQFTIIYWLVNEFFSLFRNNMRRVSLLNFLQYASGYSSSTLQRGWSGESVEELAVNSEETKRDCVHPKSPQSWLSKHSPEYWSLDYDLPENHRKRKWNVFYLPIFRVLEMSYTESNYKRFLFSEYIHTFKK